nr:unnamed protein product [Callosobruchus chinensis]
MSHYNQLGWYDDVEWTTTTGEALQQIYRRRKDLEVNPYKTIINLHSEVYDCDNASEVSPYCPVDYEESYLSMTHYSYPPPYPCVLRRVSMPKTPFFLNRKLNSTGGTGKFQDDDYIYQTKRLQQFKQQRQGSYNPCTGEYSDGTPGFVEQFSCVPLSF